VNTSPVGPSDSSRDAADDTAATEQAVTLPAHQLRKLGQSIAVAVTEALREDVTRAGRASFTLAEVGRRNAMSIDTIRRHVRAGLLRVVRPGGKDQVRVTVEAEALWLVGKHSPSDLPADGYSPKVVARNKQRAIVAGVMRKRPTGLVHRA